MANEWPYVPPKPTALYGKVVARQIAAKLDEEFSRRNISDSEIVYGAGVKLNTVRAARCGGRVTLENLARIIAYAGLDIEEVIQFTQEERDEWKEAEERYDTLRDRLET